ncbi:MAG: cyclic-di-AMP receptor [Anaerolineaceae bacterium]
MKMIMAIVPKQYSDDVLSALINAGFTATYSETRGGVLRQSQTTLFIAVRTSDVQTALSLITDSCMEIVSIHHRYGPEADTDAHMVNEAAPLGKSAAVVFIWTLDKFQVG